MKKWTTGQILIFTLTMASATCLASEAGARMGSHAGNGGHVVTCLNQAPVVLDFYHARLKSIGDIQPPELVDAETTDLVALIKGRMDTREHGNNSRALLPYRFEKSLAIVGPVEKWIDTPLNMVHDMNLVYPLPPHCELQQAANRHEGTQYGDSSVINKLSKGQKKLLEIHEALYLMVQGAGGDDSHAVRTYLRAILQKNITAVKIQTANSAFAEAVTPYAESWQCMATCFVSAAANYGGADSHPVSGYGTTLDTAVEDATNRCKEKGPRAKVCNSFDFERGVCIEGLSPAKNCLRLE
jgi:hypothetical protein